MGFNLSVYLVKTFLHVREKVLLPLVPTTALILIGFGGTNPVDILLNGLTTIFIIEMDDVIAEVGVYPLS